jgi:hypothetical protein
MNTAGQTVRLLFVRMLYAERPSSPAGGAGEL